MPKPKPDHSKIPKQGRLGGVDFGTVRIGLATCDPSQQWVTPFDTYQARNKKLDAEYFCDVAARESIVGWVIGLPIHCDGQESQKSTQVRDFGDWLSTATRLPHAFYDERFSTGEARRLLQDSGLGQKQKKKRLDRLAAHLILSHFLDSRRHKTTVDISQQEAAQPIEDDQPPL